MVKIEGRYAPYHDFNADTTGASVEAAVAAAAYYTLKAYLKAPPSLVSTLDGEYSAWLTAHPDPGQAVGAAVGKAASDDLVALRANDGLNAVITTPYGQCAASCAPGVWGFAPLPDPQVAFTPWMAFMRPFLLDSASQFRPEPPPDIDSPQFARDLNETRTFGSINSAVRTPAQTDVAYFWLANNINQNSKAYRDYATAHNFDLVDASRLLAMGMVVSSDAFIACWEAKYTYLFWRPIWAIRETVDPSWTPLATTPQHPEYPSAHGCDSGAMGTVFATVAGTHKIDVDIWGAQGGATTLTVMRHYHTVKDLEEEMENARVWVGFHYRNSVEAGNSLGEAVARWELARFFQPVESE